MIGADEVYDTNFGADLTALEESAEFLDRLEKGGPFPMFTSCCPAWVKYVEMQAPQFLRNLSTCKSPMQMFAAVLKDQYRAKDEEDGRKTFHIAVMPCTAKKMEARRAEFQHDGQQDVDLVLTTQEVIMMIKESGIHFGELEGEAPDLPFGMGTGAATIFGTTGGVNTHKGAIFTLGLICGAVGRLWKADCPCRNPERILAESAAMAKDAVNEEFAALNSGTARTAGEKLYLKYGLDGARGEAAQGFPGVAQIALPVLKKARQGCSKAMRGPIEAGPVFGNGRDQKDRSVVHPAKSLSRRLCRSAGRSTVFAALGGR